MDAMREISAKEVSDMLKTGKKFTVLDVREEWELTYAQILNEHVINLPLSKIGRELQEAFPAELRQPEAEIVVMCHHGARSANVTTWMMQNGWKNVSNLTGGIDAYANEVDSSVGQY